MKVLGRLLQEPLKSRKKWLKRLLDHYADLTRVNYRSQSGGRSRRRARRRFMPGNITFNQLKAVMRSRVGQPGMPSHAALPNAYTALGKFCRAVTIDMDTRVGNSLRDEFDDSLELFRAQLERGTQKPESINNSISQVKSWARLTRVLDHEGASAEGDLTPFQSKLSELFDTRKDMFRVARQAKVSWRTLRNWKRGGMPKSTSDDALRRLAVACGEPPDILVKLLPFAVGRKLACEVPVIKIASRAHRAKLARSPYLLKPREIDELHLCVREEWRGQLRHKIPLGKVIADDSASVKPTILERIRAAKETKPDDRDREWRVRPVADYRSPDMPAWVNTIGGVISPSAEKFFKDVTSFLGWLRLPAEKGGRDVPIERLSMGMIVDEEALDEYLEWHGVRVNSVNAGTTSFIASVRSLVRPKTGYLWLSTEIGRRVGYDERTWRLRCKRLNDAMGLRLAQYASIKEPSRDTETAIQPLLDMPRPLQGFKDAITQYARQVRRNSRERATQARDLALLAVSISNPLRLTNLRLLTYKPDNTGHFRRTKAGFGWEVFVPKAEFKNIRGAAKHKDYYMPLSETAAHYLEGYLTKWWNVLGGAGSRGLVFVATDKPDILWDALDCQYASVTEKILAPIGCPSIRPHAARYLVGTAIIIASKGNVDLAAAALHDTKSTVEKHYKKLLNSFGARGIQAAIGRDLSFDEDAVGLVAVPDAS
jgi:hypothetical protein